MLYLLIKALISGALIAVASEVARRWPGVGGLIVSLPLTSLLAMIWLWRDTGDAEGVAQLSMGAFWFILPSLPLFWILPVLLRSGLGFWISLTIGIAFTMALYAGMFFVAPRIGLKI